MKNLKDNDKEQFVERDQTRWNNATTCNVGGSITKLQRKRKMGLKQGDEWNEREQTNQTGQKE